MSKRISTAPVPPITPRPVQVGDPVIMCHTEGGGLPYGVVAWVNDDAAGVHVVESNGEEWAPEGEVVVHAFRAPQMSLAVIPAQVIQADSHDLDYKRLNDVEALSKFRASSAA